MARKVLLTLRTVAVTPYFAVSTIGVASVIVATALVSKDSPVIQRLIEWWSRMFIRSLGAKITVEGRDTIDPTGQYLFVANHSSNADIPAMFLTAPVPIRYLAKKEVFRLPVVGLAMRRIGMVKVDRQGGSAILEEVNSGIAEVTKRGHSLIIFPEGTRSNDGRPAHFKRGAFRIAISNQLTIVPVSIEGTWDVWAPGSKSVRPGHIQTKLHQPIPTKGLTLADVEEVRTMATDAIVSGWEALRTERAADSSTG